jgi:hypothetical protein
VVGDAANYKDGAEKLAHPDNKPAADDKPAADKQTPAQKAGLAKLTAAGEEALSGLPETTKEDAAKTPGAVGQGEAGGGSMLPDWFMGIQNRLVASTVWGEAEEKAQLAIRAYAMYLAKTTSRTPQGTFDARDRGFGRIRKGPKEAVLKEDLTQLQGALSATFF